MFECKNKSRCFRSFLLSILFALMGIVGIGGVNAASIDYESCSESVIAAVQSKYEPYGVINSIKARSDYHWTNAITMLNSNGHVVYCTEKGIYPLNHADGSNPSYVSSNESVENSMLARVLAYGYYADTSSTSCTTSRVATQVLVHFVSKEIADGTIAWRTLSQSGIQSTLSGSNAAAVAAEAVRIRTEVLNHDIYPSFAFSTSQAASQDPNRMELKYVEANRNFTNSETDSKAVLSTYTLVASPTSVTTTKNGNTLTITSKDDSVTTPISMSKTFKTGGTVYKRGDSKLQQTTYITTPSTKTVNAYIGYKYEKIGKGIIKIHKIDKYTGANMKGATFGIFQDDECTKKAVDYLGNELSDKKTNKNGIVSWDNLYYPLKAGESRTYYVKETQTIKGYAFDNDELDKLGAKNACIPVKITADYIEDENGSATTEINKNEEFEQAIYNIPYGNITILKQDEETGKVVEGVEFELVKNNSKKDPAIDINGNIVKNVVTDERGIAEFENIPYGDYILREVKANDWYKVLEKPIEFTLNKDNDALKYVDQGTEAVPEENEPMIPLEKYKLGDPTDDGKINNDDIAVIDNIIAEAIEETPLQFYASDVNKDNVVDAKDKELMQKYIDGDNTAIPNALTEEDIPGQVQKRVTLSITNVPIDMKVSKQSITNEKELKGATIVIKNAKGEVFIKYVSTTKPKEFYIPIGDYTLVETVAPKGYQTLKTEVKFRVLSDGNIKLLSAKSNMYELVKSKEDNDTDLDHLKIYNNLEKISVPNTGSVIAISTLIVGILLIGGGSYVIYRRYKTN